MLRYVPFFAVYHNNFLMELKSILLHVPSTEKLILKFLICDYSIVQHMNKELISKCHK